MNGELHSKSYPFHTPIKSKTMTKERAEAITGDRALFNNTMKGEFSRTIYTAVKCLLNQSHRIEYPLFPYGETGFGKNI